MKAVLTVVLREHLLSLNGSSILYVHTEHYVSRLVADNLHLITCINWTDCQ